MSGTYRDLLIRSKSRCFASNNQTWGLGPLETRYSYDSHAVLHAENHRCSLRLIHTCNFGHKVAVLNAQNHRWWLEPIETSISGANHAVLHAQNKRWGLVPIETCLSGANRAVFHTQNDRWRLGPIESCTLVQKSLFCMQKPQMKAGSHRDL